MQYATRSVTKSRHHNHLFQSPQHSAIDLTGPWSDCGLQLLVIMMHAYEAERLVTCRKETCLRMKSRPQRSYHHAW